MLSSICRRQKKRPRGLSAFIAPCRGVIQVLRQGLRKLGIKASTVKLNEEPREARLRRGQLTDSGVDTFLY